MRRQTVQTTHDLEHRLVGATPAYALAHFAATHTSWRTTAAVTAEDLIASLADKIWKPSVSLTSTSNRGQSPGGVSPRVRLSRSTAW